MTAQLFLCQVLTAVSSFCFVNIVHLKSSLMKCKICGCDSDEEPRDDEIVERMEERLVLNKQLNRLNYLHRMIQLGSNRLQVNTPNSESIN